jgi:23S rRNA (uridine2552-2'-O)-methyltransferase
VSKKPASNKPGARSGRQNAKVRAARDRKKFASLNAAKAPAAKKSVKKAAVESTAPDTPKPEAPRTPGKQAPGKKSGSKKGSDGFGLKVHVRTARKRSHSSTLWLERQLNDPYVTRARREGYRSRAAYKLLEIDDRFKLLKPGMKVVDLGAAPGGWAQIAAVRTKSVDQGMRGAGRVIGIDLLEVEDIPGVEFAVMDFTEEDAPERLRAMLAGKSVEETLADEAEGIHVRADAVLSDMAANTTGHKKTDHLRIMYLAELAVDFARQVLAPGGFFLSKVFQGGTEGDLLAMLKRDFETVRHIKPKASRADSAELYVLATGFRGAQEPRSGA